MNGKGEFRRLLRAAEQLNFNYEGVTGNGHHRFRHASTGRFVTTARTPSCPNAWKQAIRDMKRVVKGQW